MTLINEFCIPCFPSETTWALIVPTALPAWVPLVRHLSLGTPMPFVDNDALLAVQAAPTAIANDGRRLCIARRGTATSQSDAAAVYGTGHSIGQLS